jgi:hypothetical protein
MENENSNVAVADTWIENLNRINLSGNDSEKFRDYLTPDPFTGNCNKIQAIKDFRQLLMSGGFDPGLAFAKKSVEILMYRMIPYESCDKDWNAKEVIKCYLENNKLHNIHFFWEWNDDAAEQVWTLLPRKVVKLYNKNPQPNFGGREAVFLEVTALRNKAESGKIVIEHEMRELEKKLKILQHEYEVLTDKIGIYNKFLNKI